jgi:hypothetical protein
MNSVRTASSSTSRSEREKRGGLSTAGTEHRNGRCSITSGPKRNQTDSMHACCADPTLPSTLLRFDQHMNAYLDKAGYFLRAATFNARRYFRGFTVNPEPAFEQDELEFFRSVIPHSKIYLEYGSGGSTILAAQYVSTLVSVESDWIFAKAVRNALPPSRAEVHILSPALGPTRDWGYPVFGRPTPKRIARWKRYPQAPWPVLGSDIPDTILIDGRARVACALETLLHVPRSSLLIIDDYVDRPYTMIERFADVISTHGRMAAFRKRDNFDEEQCRAMLNLTYADMR